MQKMSKTQEQSDLQAQQDAKREQEVYSLMRESGRSRVQVLNAITVRGPDRANVLRALGVR